MQDLVQLEPLAKDVPQTKRGHERCLALLISATELFLEHGYDAVSLGEFKHEVRQFQKPYDNQQAEQISLMV
ncbi:hypothetical protein F899_01571 [Acinetobacter sp. CIP 101934]|jgi:hypothetical protein|uniref:HTH tetR-type domain-containing protein n=1 Tax=Acinetobacter schindleri NIPH 900 TaxID=1217675 RepID=N8XR79_9GAMM|nr:hypothetical protein F965_03032 [Acinetobacter schindleri NIPH 900]ENV14438.1 hypothetical protein F965_00682 [Acinetobacter schindleri NIPH 900]ENX00938.1 hypothetical protein F899_01571 [Acinetobacter sp. CIP 101934]MBB4836899.1 hypothetical protein [Acinetobacter schindleri]POV73557.1 hypothetical protein C3421_16080 [Acinetobacter sp. ACNIH4]